MVVAIMIVMTMMILITKVIVMMILITKVIVMILVISKVIVMSGARCRQSFYSESENFNAAKILLTCRSGPVLLWSGVRGRRPPLAPHYHHCRNWPGGVLCHVKRDQCGDRLL